MKIKSLFNTEFDEIVYLLQGGGALGAYQLGAYEALTEIGYLPDWIVGISIGAINASIIVGSPPEKRLEMVTTHTPLSKTTLAPPFSPIGGALRSI